MVNADPVPITAAPMTTTLSHAASASSSGNNDQWRIFVGLALLAAAYIFRIELVRFTLTLAKRSAPGLIVWIKQFEKILMRPISWVVFVLMVWLSTYVMQLSDLLGIKEDLLGSIIQLLLGIPLIWTVICLCNYVTWGIIRVKGWNRATSKDDDDYNRVMIITEGIAVIRILLIATVVSTFMIGGIGEITQFDSSQISTVAILVVEIVVVLGGHTWLKNTLGGLLALFDEQVKSGSHVRFHGHEGVIERLFLQCFSLRRYDKGLVYVPNGLLLEHSVEINTKTIDRQSVISIHVDHSTTSSTMRKLIQELDNLLTRRVTEDTRKRRNTVLGLERKTRGFMDAAEPLKAIADQDEGSQVRFWISIAAPYVIQVVYYTHEQHLRAVQVEKTELILRITELLAAESIKLHGAQNESRPLPSGDALRTPRLHTRFVEPILEFDEERDIDALQRAASDSSVLRQRRSHIVSA
ncbi:hypothetical protein Poli38472_006387 [Pythium oligandrum]|uniref:Mechanosensitive ion channel MscS domain-containing protein n=1 Tax=Pythium oligandrum TaxID=41045 RepID=A0A8K1C4J5_PYTOL|nr:hypothetical protein Poli38472_006387 [Pythium oligandrum]|eukprot:TMW56377.1 hypothetical protein Poli38472_006387 [Pythium oligandrum]